MSSPHNALHEGKNIQKWSRKLLEPLEPDCSVPIPSPPKHAQATCTCRHSTHSTQSGLVVEATRRRLLEQVEQLRALTTSDSVE